MVDGCGYGKEKLEEKTEILVHASVSVCRDVLRLPLLCRGSVSMEPQAARHTCSADEVYV